MYNPGLNGQLNTYDDYTASSSAYEASGIYNRAIYILNNQYSWDIPQLFQVFSKANKLYWTESIGFDDALCGLYEALADEYGTNSTKLLLLEDELEDAFSQVSLSCERNQTITICGDDPNSYCIYKDVVPSTTEAKVFTAEANLENNYEYWWLGNGINATVEFKILDNPCISPEISFAYEDIDLQWDTQYIDVFDAEENLIERCGSEDECGQWNTTCINSRKLGLLQIEPNNVYTVTIRVPSGVNAWCWEHNYAVRAKIKLKCNLDTPEPTAPVPSAAPITFAPTVPTVEPTAPTTAYPTHQIIDCSGTDDNGTYTQRYCYFEDVNANTENQTVSTVRITNEAEFAFRYYDINYTIQNYDCIDPKITFTYETVK